MSPAVQFAEPEIHTSSTANRATGLAMRLAGARSVIEGKFLDLGKTLETSVDVVGGLVTSLDQLASLFNSETVDDATGKLSAAAAELSGLAGSRVGHRERCHALAGASRRLGVHITDMQQALRYLKVFAVNIKVTAGTVPGAYVEFEDFVEEIYAAIAEGRTQLDEFGRDLDALGGLVGTALSHENDLDSRCAQVLPAVPNQLAADAVILAEHHKRVAAVAAEVGAIARGLQGKVGMALCGLQIGDTARQRVEHVETGLEILERRRAAGEASPAADDIVRAMLAAQLDDTVESFDREVEKIAHSLAGVASDAYKLLQLREAARGSGGRGDKTGDLARLEASLGEAMSLVREMGAAEAAALDVGQSAETTAAGLAQRIDAIRGIKASIHSMALNAHLKCVRLGDAGRPLSVVAVELRQYADVLGDTAGQAETILTQFGGEVDVDAATRGGSAAVGALLETAAAPIREAESKVGSELAEMAAQGDAVVQVLQRATGRLNFQAEVSGVLTVAADGLRPAATTALDALDETETAALADVMGQIGKLYTMARERQVHAAYAPA